MVSAKSYTLCGGTFLVLLLHAINNEAANESKTFSALLKVAFPTYPNYPDIVTMKTLTSQYRNCKKAKSRWLPFNSPPYIEKFDEEIKNSYQEPLQRMLKFTRDFLDDKIKTDWLIRAICETISRDPSIEDTAVFYMCANQKPVTKKTLLTVNNIDPSSFLLGVWHYILINRNDNTIGRSTFEAWHRKPRSNGLPWIFTSTVGQKYKIPINPSTTSQNSPSDTNPPKIDTNDPLVPQKNRIQELRHKYSEYLKNASKKCREIRIILYSKDPRNFEDFYVCNVLSYISKEPNANRVVKIEATAEKLKECSNFISFAADGGMGKSMMLRHLLLDAVKNGFEKIPIFIPLKDYRAANDSLIGFFFEKFNQLGGANTIDEFEELLIRGECLLLLDALDEIKSDDRLKFENDLGNFTDKYKDNMFILSSRPVYSLPYLEKFEPVDLWPFTKDQAIEAMEKLEFQPNTTKKKFIEELKNGLFETHKTFAENPLLLTIMLLTYSRNNNLPSEMHRFYWEAYLTLLQNHDATKHFRRPLNTNLTPSQFAEYFSGFCARSYYAQQFSFDDFEFQEYFGNISIDASKKITALDFRDDLISVGLMQLDGNKCTFIHRSMQEFFCAWYTARQDGEYLKKHVEFFDAKGPGDFSGRTFSMLYNMAPREAMEKYMFEPALSKLFEDCNKYEFLRDDSAYLNFLLLQYPELHCVYAYDKDVIEEEPYIRQSYEYSHICSFIMSIKNMLTDPIVINLKKTAANGYVTSEWGYLDENYHHPEYTPGELVEIPYLSKEYLKQFGKPKTVVAKYSLDLSLILDGSSPRGKIVDALCDDEFSLKKAFLALRKYWQSLVEKYSCSEE